MAPRIYVGRFDPRFLGVTIRARDVADVHSFRLHDPALRPQTALLEGLGDDVVISDLSRQTVLDHEIRHFRDSLLFPFGAVTTRSRINASYNGFLVAAALKRLRGNANALAVPLQQWLRMPEARRADYLDSVRRDLRMPPLPVIARDDDLSEFGSGPLKLSIDEQMLVVGCRVALADYQRVEDLWRCPYKDGAEAVVAALDIWEAAGLLCQLAAMEAHAGNDLMQRFLNWIKDHGPLSYRRGLTALNACLATMGWDPTLRNLLALATWAQMGAFATEMTASSPCHRLASIVAGAQKGRKWVSDSPFLELITSWDELTETDSIAALRDATDNFDRFAEQAARSDGGMAARLSPELFTALCKARHRMLAAFLTDPDAYVDTTAYLRDDAGYPRPCVGVQYPADYDAGTEWVDATPDGWSPTVGFNATLQLAVMAHLSDAIFLPGEKSLQQSGRTDISRQLGLEAILIIQ